MNLAADIYWRNQSWNLGNTMKDIFPMDPITLSEDDWGVQSPPQQGIKVPLPFSEGDWIPRD